MRKDLVQQSIYQVTSIFPPHLNTVVVLNANQCFQMFCTTQMMVSEATHYKPVMTDYSLHTVTTVTPGAGCYEYDRDFEDNDNPAYSIALPLPQKPSKLISGHFSMFLILAYYCIQMRILHPIGMM